MKKILNIEWLGKCPKCQNKLHQVTTKKGNQNWLYDYDKVKCLCCGHNGEIDTDGEFAWVVWEEK